MAKITPEAREQFKRSATPYNEKISEVLSEEKKILELIKKESDGSEYKKLLLCEKMLYISSLYILINNLSMKYLDVKNNDALNDSRKILYKAIIYLEEIVTTAVNIPYSDLEEPLKKISNTPFEKRYLLIRKLGFCIDDLEHALGENSKWKWSFVELKGRFTTVAKNFIDMKQASKSYFDSSLSDYEVTVLYVRLMKKLLNNSAAQYRDKYELSTRRVDDMRQAINFLLAQRRLCIAIGQSDQAEEVKKKAAVWKTKMESDQKSGLSS